MAGFDLGEILLGDGGLLASHLTIDNFISDGRMMMGGDWVW
jgi:hypothetical protein